MALPLAKDSHQKTASLHLLKDEGGRLFCRLEVLLISRHPEATDKTRNS